jgi:hypothetical protein
MSAPKLPQLQFVKVCGEVGIVVHSAAALHWLLKNPPPASLPVYLSRVVAKELKEEAKMPEAKDGSKHHSFGRAKLHDDMESDRKAKAGPKSMEAPKKESKGEAEPKAKGEAEGGEDNMETMPETPTPIEQHVQQHGPADEVHHKIGGDGMHHVLTHHGGQKHKSVHGTHDEAYAHMGKAMGAMAGPLQADGGGMSPVAPPPAGGGGIPGMM